jgi:hypothetical protein
VINSRETGWEVKARVDMREVMASTTVMGVIESLKNGFQRSRQRLWSAYFVPLRAQSDPERR